MYLLALARLFHGNFLKEGGQGGRGKSLLCLWLYDRLQQAQIFAKACSEIDQACNSVISRHTLPTLSFGFHGLPTKTRTMTIGSGAGTPKLERRGGMASILPVCD